MLPLIHGSTIDRSFDGRRHGGRFEPRWALVLYMVLAYSVYFCHGVCNRQYSINSALLVNAYTPESACSHLIYSALLVNAYTPESSRSQLYIDLNRVPVYNAIMAVPVTHLSKIDRLAVVRALYFISKETMCIWNKQIWFLHSIYLIIYFINPYLDKILSVIIHISMIFSCF